MNSLTDYFPSWQIEGAWMFGPRVIFRAPDPGEERRFYWDVRGDDRDLMMIDFSVEDKTTVLMQLLTLWKFMKKGPVIVKPDPNLGRALMDTEIRVPATSYRQPYEVMGVELPEEVAGPFHPCLMMVWRPNDRFVCAWVIIKTGMTYFLKIGDDLPTIEDRIALQEGVEDETDYRILIQGGRLALNACLLASHRDTDLTPLPREVRNQREARNGNLRRQGLQVYQEIRYRDLVVRPRPHRDVMEGFGGRQMKQRRSGHWRNVAHGPKFSLHRWTWIDEYETHRDEVWVPPTTIVR